MRKLLIVLSGLLFWVCFAQAQQAFQITSIDASPMTRANLCTSLGGSRLPPALVIHHSKIGGAKITVKMFDDTSRGSHIDHRSTVVSSNPSGVTRLNFAFLPPCNRTGLSTSNYSISAEANGSKKQTVFGRYDSAARWVFR